MSVWTIECATATPPISDTFAALGLSNLQRTLVDQDADEVTFSAPASLVDVAPLFPYKATVIIKKDGVQWFLGRVQTVPSTGAASEESKRYRLVGPWWWLEKCIYQQLWRLWIPDAGEVPGHLDDGYNSLVILCQNYAGARITSGAQIAAAVQFAISEKSAPLQLGTVDPALYLPWDERTNTSVAEVIRAMLRFSPDCHTCFDYSTSPPTLHVLKRASMSSVSYSIPAGTAIESLRITPRHDLCLPGLVIRYEQTHTSDDETYRTVSVDTAGDPDDIETPVFSLELAGGSRSTMSQLIKTEYLPDDFTGLDDKTWWISKCPALKALDAATLSIHDTVILDAAGAAVDREQELDDDDQPIPYTGLRILSEGTITEWMQEWEKIVGVWTVVGGVSATPVTIRCLADYTVLSTSSGHPVAKKIIDEPITFSCILTDAKTGADNERTYTRLESSTTAEPVPVGLAQAIYDAWAQLQYDGQIAIVAEECATGATPGRVLNLTGGLAAWATMNAMICAVSENVDTGTTSIRFGPSRNLGPDDVIQLFRAMRSRQTSYQWKSRLSGKSADSGQNVALAGPGPLDKNSHVAGETTKMVLKSGSKIIQLDPVDITTETALIKARAIQVCEDGVVKTMWILCSETY